MADLEQVACPQCGSGESVVRAQGRDYLYQVPGTYTAAECRTCGLWYQNPRPPVAQLVNLYPTSYLPHAAASDPKAPAVPPAWRRVLRTWGYPDAAETGTRRFAVRSARRFVPWVRWQLGVELIPRFVPGGRLLEIGCGNGSRLASLRRLGWQHLHGIELVPAAAEQARARGFEVVCGPVEDVLKTGGDGAFDVVICSMVLEHLLDPFAVVRQVAGRLKPGGQFLFSTVCRDGLDARLYGPYWAGFDFPRHMTYLRKRDVGTMIAADFGGLECFHQAAPIDYVRSSRWRRDNQVGTLFDRLMLALGLSKPAKLLHLLLAWLRLTSRVSFRCRRKNADHVA